jgi:hypothetical protein
MLISELLFEFDSVTSTSGTIDKSPLGYSTDKDNHSSLKLSDMRKSRLTLGQLNKLRMMNDIRKIEFAQKIKTVSKQYATPSDNNSGGMM